MKKFAVAALSALLLTLAGCGGNGSDAGTEADAADADDQVAAKSISDSIMEGQDAQGASGVFTMGREEADCIGDSFVAGIGTEQLQEYGFLTEDLTSADDLANVKMSSQDAESAASTLFDCTDVSKMMSEAFNASGNVDEKTQQCLEDALSEDVLREMFTLMFSGKQDAASQLATEPMMKCATP
ncbi:MAG: hypothetical protein ACR2HA_06860 [Nocardioides sp.]